MKLSTNQIKTIKVLREYPNDMAMYDGWLTGGHGIKLNLKSVQSLKDKGLIEKWGEKRGTISELGKTIELPK